jgi:ATP-binding cassette, subfamily B, multidrug efflux pump
MSDIGKLLRFLRPYRGLALFALAMLLAMVFLDLAVPRLVERIIDEGIRRKDLPVVLSTSALMIGISLLSALVAVLNSNSSVRVGESVARDLREAIFVKAMGFSFADLDRFSTGKLMVRLTSDAGAVQRLTQVTLRIGTRAPLTMIGAVALMFVTSPPLAAAMIPFLLVAGASIVFFSARMEPLFGTVQRKLDRLNTVLQENIAGARLVKSFVRSGREAERFEAANADLTGGTVRVMRLMSMMTPILTLFINAAMVLVVWLGGGKAIKGSLSLGQIVAFTNYLLATMNPLVMMTQLSNTWANGLASAKRINEVLDSPSSISPAAADTAAGAAAGASVGGAASPARGAGAVSFRSVSFGYEGASGPLVLEDIDLEAAGGSTVAILGATGAGKTSLINLIPRFYDVSRGAVLIDGVDVREMGEESLRAAVGIVPQETILLSGTVRDNIRYGRPEAALEEVLAAARAAQAHEFILKLPQGYDTRVEERGVNLSGGQKQRLAIARAIVARPRVLILDDSTSAVDIETETKIQAALAELLAGTTCFVVAQRISTVLNADLIVVLEEGRIAARGNHRELLRSSPVYREIYDSQLGGGIDEQAS